MASEIELKSPASICVDASKALQLERQRREELYRHYTSINLNTNDVLKSIPLNTLSSSASSSFLSSSISSSSSFPPSSHSLSSPSSCPRPLLTREISVKTDIGRNDLSPSETNLLLSLFREIDTDADLEISIDEGIEFGNHFVDSLAGAGVGTDAMFAAVDTNKDGVLSEQEWLNYFGSLIDIQKKEYEKNGKNPKEAQEEIMMFLVTMREHVKISKRHVKWFPRTRVLFLLFLFFSVILFSAVVGYSSTQSTLWKKIAEIKYSTEENHSSTKLRFAYSIMGLILSALGAFAAFMEWPRLLTAYGLLSLIVWIINISSGIYDATLASSVRSLCIERCLDDGLSNDECKCSWNYQIPVPIALTALLVVFTAFPLFTSLFYSTNCGQHRYMRLWLKAWNRLPGTSAMRKAFWFKYEDGTNNNHDNNNNQNNNNNDINQNDGAVIVTE